MTTAINNTTYQEEGFFTAVPSAAIIRLFINLLDLVIRKPGRS